MRAVHRKLIVAAESQRVVWLTEWRVRLEGSDNERLSDKYGQTLFTASIATSINRSFLKHEKSIVVWRFEQILSF
jgi:hypothetical protein